MVHTPQGSLLSSGRGQVAEAVLGATRVSHVVIGTFCTLKLAIVDADVASEPGSDAEVRGRAVAMALRLLCRSFGVDETPGTAHDGRATLAAEISGNAGVAWLDSERCMIGMWRKPSETAPFVALIRDRSAHVFPHWQRDVARIGLLYETERSARSQPVQALPQRAPLNDILQQLGACALVDAARNMIYANHAANRWIRECGGLQVTDGRLSAVVPDMQRRLCAAVRSATTDEPRSAQAILLKGRHRGDPPQAVTCLPVPGAEANALLIFGEGSRSAALTEALLNAFGLTSAERRLACHLLHGRTLEEAAEGARIRISTARSYLKAIFAKTGVRRQSQFVAVVGALVPPIVGRAPEPASRRMSAEGWRGTGRAPTTEAVTVPGE